MARKPIKKRAQSSVLEYANVDTAGLDPEMKETLSGEAARRAGAAGVRVETRNPLAGLFKRRKKTK